MAERRIIMTNKKYKLLENDTIQMGNGATLYRIEALTDFGLVKTGDKGGYIEKEKNLSQYDNAWVSGNAYVYSNAQVYGSSWVDGDARIGGNTQVSGNARIYGNAQVDGNAWISNNASIYGDAQVFGNACVYGDATIYGQAQVYGDSDIYEHARVYEQAVINGDVRIHENAQVYGDAHISGNARVGDYALIYGDAQVSGLALVYSDACISGSKSIVTVHPVGPHDDTFTAYPNKTGGIIVSQMSFFGQGLDETLSTLEPRIRKEFEGNPDGDEYKKVIELIKLKLQDVK